MMLFHALIENRHLFIILQNLLKNLMRASFKKRNRSNKPCIQNKKEPVTCIIGGSKISTKINVITSLIKKVNNL